MFMIGIGIALEYEHRRQPSSLPLKDRFLMPLVTPTAIATRPVQGASLFMAD
jgi:hypothetical protein